MTGGVKTAGHSNLNYAPEIQSMIYTTNCIERLSRDFRRVTRMRTAMPNEESVLTLMGSVAMEHKAFDRLLPNITCDKTLFPDEWNIFLAEKPAWKQKRSRHHDDSRKVLAISIGVVMLLTGCSSAEPVSSSDYNTKLAFLI